MRINGNARLSTDPELLAKTAIDGKLPKIAVVVHTREAFIHCAKAIRRSSLWSPDKWPSVGDMATISCMVVAHAKLDIDPTVMEANLDESYAKTMWNE